jgi:CopG family nickel-responsive transcriptional regulator
MGEDLVRMSVTVPPELVAELDDLVESWDYASRSEAARDALREFVSDYRWRTRLEGRQRGMVAVLYDHDAPGVSERLLDLQHEAHETILSVQHIHLSDHQCLETLVVDGPAEEIERLVNRIQSLKGTKQVQLSVVG